MTLIAVRMHDSTEDGRVAFVNPTAVALLVPAKFDVAGETVDGSQLQLLNGWHFYVHGDPENVAVDLNRAGEL